MIPVTAMKGKKVALFGLGGSGNATALALMAGGAAIVAFDDNPASVEKAAALNIPTGDLNLIDWKGYEALILSPGVPLTHPKPHWSAQLAKANGVPVIGDVELFARERKLRAPKSVFVAITGTNGKSTTTALTAHILKASGRNAQMGGNIGRAVLSLDDFTDGAVYVVECSSYQIDLAPGLAPSHGALLNLTPDHIDRHGTMENYAAIKKWLVEGSDFAVIGIDDNWSAAIARELRGKGRKIKTLNAGKAAMMDIGIDYRYHDGVIEHFSAEGTKTVAKLQGISSLRGAHNGQNAAAAYAICHAIGLTDKEIQAGLSSFPGLQHRMEQVASRDGVLFINDSKATNADAAATALLSFEHIFWIAGGLPKEGGIASLQPLFGRVEKAFLIGEAAAGFAVTLGDKVPYQISGTLTAAIGHAFAAAREYAAKHNVEVPVLLSPACASFDQFANFEVRGQAFKDAVKALLDNVGA